MRKEPRSGIFLAFPGFPVPFQGLCSHPCRTSQQYRYPFLAATSFWGVWNIYDLI